MLIKAPLKNHHILKTFKDMYVDVHIHSLTPTCLLGYTQAKTMSVLP